MIGVCVDMKAQQRSWNNGGQHDVGGQVDALLDAQLHPGHPVQQACLKSQLRWRSHLTAPDLFYYSQVGGFGCLPHHTCSSCQRYPKSPQTTPLCIRWVREGFKIKITSEKIGFTQLYGNLVAWKSILGKSIARMSYHSAQPKRQPLFFFKQLKWYIISIFRCKQCTGRKNLDDISRQGWQRNGKLDSKA